MKHKLTAAARLLLGLIFFVFGLNGFLNFIPVPPNLPPQMVAFMGGMNASVYFLPLLKGTEVFVGALLLVGVAVPVALVILAPIVINIFFVHLFLTPGLENLILPIFIIILQAVAMNGHCGLYRPLFQHRCRLRA